MQFVQEKSTSAKTNTIDSLKELLGLLRAQYWNYQSSHWQSKGNNFYGNHLLFQRLYESVPEQIDTLAEKLVGYFDEKAVDSVDSITKAQNWIKKWSKTDDIVKRAIESEKDFQKFLKQSYDQIKTNDDMHLGLDDFLMSISSDHDTNMYLLQQASK